MVCAFCALALLFAIGAEAARPTQIIETAGVGGDYLPLPGLTVHERGSAESCGAGSDAVGNAYRCFGGHGVYDPCWKDASDPIVPAVICRFQPWSKSVIRLTLDQGGLPAFFAAGEPIATYPPWGVELSGGSRCVAAQGAHDSFSGHVVNYYCTPKLSKHTTRVLVGQHRNHNGIWRFRSAKMTRHGNSYSHKLGGWLRAKKAWYAMQDRSNEISASTSTCSVGALAFAGMAYEESNNEPLGPLPKIITHACDSGFAIALIVDVNDNESALVFKATPTGWSEVGSVSYVEEGAFGIPEDARSKMVAAVQGNPSIESVYF